MNIGMDLDSTLIGWLIRPEKKAAWDLNIKDYPDTTDFEFSTLIPSHVKRIKELFLDPDFMGPANVVFDPLDKLKLSLWKEEGHRLIVITSRKEPVRKATEMIIEEYFPEIDKLIVCSKIENKKQHMIDENLDVWIDDNPRGLRIACELKIPLVFAIVNRVTEKYNNTETLSILRDHQYLSSWFERIRSLYYVDDLESYL